MISPLRKKRKDTGQLYTRFPDIEAQLNQLDHLPPNDLIARCQIPEREPGSVPTECVLTFVRREWAALNQPLCDPLIKVLLERLRRRLPRTISRDGKSESLVRTEAAERVQDEFTSMLMGETNAYDERLDFFEISFSRALSKLSLSAKKRARRSANRQEDLYGDEGEIKAEVEEAIGLDNPFDPDLLQQDVYRSRLPVAMEQLEPLERRIAEMWRNDIPIHSNDPNIICMTGMTGRSEKGIRIIRDRAFAKLRRLLTRGE